MALLEKAATLRERIKRVKELEAKTNIAENASDKAKKVKEVREALTTHRVRATLLGLRDGGAAAWPDATATKVALERYKTALATEKDPSEPAVEAAYKLLVQAVNPVEAGAKGVVEPLIAQERAALAEIDRTALEAWKAMQADPKPIDVALAELDRLLKVSKVQWLKLPLAQLAATLEAKAAVVKTVDRLMAFQMPAEVQTFLRHAREGGGAAVEYFTDAVKTWLESNKQLGRVRVVFK